jgi:hypothetical protein
VVFEVENEEVALGSPFPLLSMLWPSRWRKNLEGLRELRIMMWCCYRLEHEERRGRSMEREYKMMPCGMYPCVEPTDQDLSHGIHRDIHVKIRRGLRIDLDYTFVTKLRDLQKNSFRLWHGGNKNLQLNLLFIF